jgi:hypothetical protein
LTWSTKISSALFKGDTTGSGRRIVVLAGRRVVTQLKTIQNHVRVGVDMYC